MAIALWYKPLAVLAVGESEAQAILLYAKTLVSEGKYIHQYEGIAAIKRELAMAEASMELRPCTDRLAQFVLCFGSCSLPYINKEGALDIDGNNLALYNALPWEDMAED